AEILCTAGVTCFPGLACLVGGSARCSLGDALVQERLLLRIQNDGRILSPALKLIQACPRRQEAGIVVRTGPLGSSGSQALLKLQIVAAGLNPGAQRLPGSDERLVRHFKGWAARGRIAVQCEQAITRKRIDDAGHEARLAVDGR